MTQRPHVLVVKAAGSVVQRGRPEVEETASVRVVLRPPVETRASDLVYAGQLTVSRLGDGLLGYTAQNVLSAIGREGVHTRHCTVYTVMEVHRRNPIP